VALLSKAIQPEKEGPLPLSVPARLQRGTQRGRALDVALVGTSLLVADGRTLRVLDVTVPASSAEVGSVDARSPARAVAGDLACSISANALRTYDISDPSVPQEA